MNDKEKEKDLIEKAKKDPREFGVLFDIYYRQIFGYTLRRTANIEIARDITSEVFLKALKNINKFHWRGISISSWLYRIASNEIMTYFRNNKYRPESLEELNEIAGFDPVEPKDLREEVLTAELEIERHKEFLKIQKILAKLPIHYQEVIALRYFEEKNIKEMSDILNKKEGTVKSLISRGIVLLRKEVEKD